MRELSNFRRIAHTIANPDDDSLCDCGRIVVIGVTGRGGHHQSVTNIRGDSYQKLFSSTRKKSKCQRYATDIHWSVIASERHFLIQTCSQPHTFPNPLCFYSQIHTLCSPYRSLVGAILIRILMTGDQWVGVFKMKKTAFEYACWTRRKMLISFIGKKRVA